jgi:hypothetical protein
MDGMRNGNGTRTKCIHDYAFVHTQVTIFKRTGLSKEIPGLT